MLCVILFDRQKPFILKENKRNIKRTAKKILTMFVKPEKKQQQHYRQQQQLKQYKERKVE